MFFEAIQTAESPRFEFTETESVSGIFDTGATPALFDFTGAVVGDIKAIDPAPGELRFDRAEFSGFDFGKHRDLFGTLNRTLCRTASMSAAAKGTVFLRAKNGATQMSENTAASRFHYREADQRGQVYWESVVAAIGDRQLWSALASTRRWLGTRFIRYSCGYGETPNRVFRSSVGTILIYR